jgi:hypothetical protein
MAFPQNKQAAVKPIQKLSVKKKGEEWRKQNMDYYIGLFDSTNGGGRKESLKILYDLYNSVFDLEDIKYVTNPFKVDDGFPASPQNFNIVKPKIDLLLGEESKRPFNFKVIQTNDGAVSQVQAKAKELLTNYVMAASGAKSPEEWEQMSLEDIQTYMRKSYKTIAEETAYHTIESLYTKLNMAHELFKGFKDALIAGEEIYYNGILNGEPDFSRINPVECDYDRDGSTEFIENGDWFLRQVYMTPSAIYDKYFDKLESKDLDDILSVVENGQVSSNSIGDSATTPLIVYKNLATSDSSNPQSSNSDTLVVYHATWKSYKKVGFLTTTDPETGEPKTMYVDETYTIDEGEDIEWKWVTEIWEGYRAGDGIYFGMGPCQYQSISIDDPNSGKLPYCGAVYNNDNSSSKSLMAIMKPLQYMYIALWYRLELAISRDKGKIINMDITQIPKSMGIDVSQWLHYLTALGVNFINPYEEGWDIPGREGGKPAQYNQMSSQDLSMSKVIGEYIQLLDKIEDMVGDLSGVSKQRQGSIQQRELVGNVERSVMQSSHITEPWFWMHNMVKKNVCNSIINVAQTAWSNSDHKKLHYLFNDSTRIFMDISEEFLYADFDIYVTDSTKEDLNIQTIKQLLQPAMQNGASLLDVAEILTSDNISQIKSKLAKIEATRTQMVQAQQQAEQGIQQMELQLKQEDLQLRDEDSRRKAETAIEVAMINADSKMEVAAHQTDASMMNTEEPVGEDNSGEMEKLKIQREKITKDSEIKNRQLAEAARKNRVAEQQKQQEIEIKRKVSNRPVATAKK